MTAARMSSRVRGAPLLAGLFEVDEHDDADFDGDVGEGDEADADGEVAMTNQWVSMILRMASRGANALPWFRRVGWKLKASPWRR